MTSDRNPGRYNLRRLGWSAFEDLCMQVMRVVLGETCARFGPGQDGGRDGWFQGVAAKQLVSENKLHGNFVIQCKHTSKQHNPLTDTDLTGELAKVSAIAADTPCHYLLMTNRQVSAKSEKKIREAFEALNGVGRCLVFAETWIEDTVDAHPRLLRLVPRLYGIGDLSQILSFSIQQQTTALLEDLAFSLRTFVPTESYRKAEKALHDHGFVVLVGPPASGKTAIAANLCMVSMAQVPETRILRIEQAEQFKSTWSPADPNTIYWVDDVFGETTLDAGRLREWSVALDKVEAARRRKARIIFCTRDYILADAERQLKRVKADAINDARVRIDVSAMSDAERDAIMYNHIKDGDITAKKKGSLKKHLSGLARLSSFTPELARRLGSQRFTKSLKIEWNSLLAFFNHPVRHFRDVIHGLSGSETGALAVCLLSNNAVPDPIPEDAVTSIVSTTYGVTVQQIREAFELLEGSLVKRVRQTTTQTWQVHHPSMIEALQEELATKSSKLILYIQGAQIASILRDTTMLPPDQSSRLVFLPESVYSHLINRMVTVDHSTVERIASYLVERASDEFLVALDQKHPEIIDRSLGILPEPYGDDEAPKLAARLSEVGGDLIEAGRRKIIAETLAQSVLESGWTGFLDIHSMDSVIPEFIGTFLQDEIDSKYPSLERLYDWFADDLSSMDHVDAAIEEIVNHCDRLQGALSTADLSCDLSERALTERKEILLSGLHERKEEIEEEEEQRADYQYDEWKERWHEERYELEHGRFSDVDE